MPARDDTKRQQKFHSILLRNFRTGDFSPLDVDVTSFLASHVSHQKRNLGDDAAFAAARLRNPSLGVSRSSSAVQCSWQFLCLHWLLAARLRDLGRVFPHLQRSMLLLCSEELFSALYSRQITEPWLICVLFSFLHEVLTLRKRILPSIFFKGCTSYRLTRLEVEKSCFLHEYVVGHPHEYVVGHQRRKLWRWAHEADSTITFPSTHFFHR